MCSRRQRSRPTPGHHSAKSPSSEPGHAEHWHELSVLPPASKPPVLLPQHQGRLRALPPWSAQGQDRCSSLLFLRHSFLPAEPSPGRADEAPNIPHAELFETRYENICHPDSRLECGYLQTSTTPRLGHI